MHWMKSVLVFVTSMMALAALSAPRDEADFYTLNARMVAAA